MKKYQVSQDFLPVFQDNPWWAFMGKYFGFPECCVKDFCDRKPSNDSLFDGTGYVPCSCCNEKIVDYGIVKKLTNTMNKKRLHNAPFGEDDNFHNNPAFFKILEDFFIANNEFPYEEIVFRGGQYYLYNKFLNKPFSFIIHLEHKTTKETSTVDLAHIVSTEHLGTIFEQLMEEGLTTRNKHGLLAEMNIDTHYKINHKKTKANLIHYANEISTLIVLGYHSFYGEKSDEIMLNILNNSQNNVKKSPLSI